MGIKYDQSEQPRVAPTEPPALLPTVSAAGAPYRCSRLAVAMASQLLLVLAAALVFTVLLQGLPSSSLLRGGCCLPQRFWQ